MADLWVLAGPNGGGKSSIGGAMFDQAGGYYNPDRTARLLREERPSIDPVEANSLAWHEGRRLLERAIRERKDFAFETTLGGRQMTAHLEEAIALGFAVHVWFVALARVEAHLARVRTRAARGGHDIPEAKIRERYDTSRENLIRLLPGLTSLRLFDNSVEADPADDHQPRPTLLLHLVRRRIVAQCEPAITPAWAKPILAAALAVRDSAVDGDS